MPSYPGLTMNAADRFPIGSDAQLQPLSRKGRNKIHEGLGAEVTVIAHHHPAHPPAVMVAPTAMPTLQSKFVRWIRLGDDPDFAMVSKQQAA